MEPLPADSERCIRRSRVRARTLVMLATLGEAYIGQLARVAGLERRRVVAALLGDPPAYRAELSLVALGLAEPLQTPNGRAFRITRRGLRKARSLTARSRRRSEGLTWSDAKAGPPGGVPAPGRSTRQKAGDPTGLHRAGDPSPDEAAAGR